MRDKLPMHSRVPESPGQNRITEMLRLACAVHKLITPRHAYAASVAGLGDSGRLRSRGQTRGNFSRLLKQGSAEICRN